MTMEGELRELWHDVEARRDDGTPTRFRIRELEPKKQLTKIFVVELPYPKTELSRLPTPADYRRLGELEEQWVRPACAALGWEVVGRKIEDGSCFLYMYGAGDPNAMIERLSPFDASLGFYDDDDPDWQEYGTLRDLLDQAKAIPAADDAARRQRAPTTAIKNKPVVAPTANGAASGETTAKGAAKAAKRATKTAAKSAKRATTAKTAAKAARPAKPTKPAKPTRATQAAKNRRKAKSAARTATKRKRR